MGIVPHARGKSNGPRERPSSLLLVPPKRRRTRGRDDAVALARECIGASAPARGRYLSCDCTNAGVAQHFERRDVKRDCRPANGAPLVLHLECHRAHTGGRRSKDARLEPREAGAVEKRAATGASRADGAAILPTAQGSIVGIHDGSEHVYFPLARRRDHDVTDEDVRWPVGAGARRCCRSANDMRVQVINRDRGGGRTRCGDRALRPLARTARASGPGVSQRVAVRIGDLCEDFDRARRARRWRACGSGGKDNGHRRRAVRFRLAFSGC